MPHHDIAAQRDLTSCGIFVLEFIRNVIKGQPNNNYNNSFRQGDIVNIRKRIALELLNQELLT